MADEDEDGQELLLPFHNQSQDFADGFECGRVWGLLRATPHQEAVFQVHLRNAQMFMEMGDRLERVVTTAEMDEDDTWERIETAEDQEDDTWVTLTFAPSGGHSPEPGGPGHG